MVDKENQKQPSDPMVDDNITNQEIVNERKESAASEASPASEDTNEAEASAAEDTTIREEEGSDTSPAAADATANEAEPATEEATSDDSKEAALAEAKDKYLRLYAEFENFRRRTARERLDLIKTASEDIVSALLPVVDDFERSLEIFKDNEAVAPMYEGIQLVHQKMMNVLEQKGLSRMEVSQGSDFDSEYHEAVVQTPAPSEDLKGKVVDVIEEGYFLGDKVLRYAKVVIGS